MFFCPLKSLPVTQSNLKQWCGATPPSQMALLYLSFYLEFLFLRETIVAMRKMLIVSSSKTSNEIQFQDEIRHFNR